MNKYAAAILLYTAPVIVMLLSAALFREKITGIKTLSAALAFAGCCLVSGIGMDSVLTVRWIQKKGTV